MDTILNNEFEIVSGGIEQLESVRALWEKLNLHHLEKSNYFTESFRKNKFDKRKTSLIKKSMTSDFYIDLIYCNKTIIGYCISSISKKVGEIESIFIENEYRGKKLGETLMNNALSWFKENNCASIIVYVAEGNENAFDFYSKFNIYPRATRLEYKM